MNKEKALGKVWSESEETKVKDIEWAKNRIKDELKFEALDLDEREIGFSLAMEEALKILDQLDEPEVLSPDWIGDNVEYAYYMTPKGTYSSAKAVIDPNKLENLLVPKQEKVMVDREDAENIVDYKVMGWALSHLIDDYGEDARHDELLAKAWLAYPNIEVEEEQKYYLKIGNLYLAEPLGDMTSDIVRMTRDKGVAYQFTDEKSIATHLDNFEGIEAVKVEELE